MIKIDGSGEIYDDNSSRSPCEHCLKAIYNQCIKESKHGNACDEFSPILGSVSSYLTPQRYYDKGKFVGQ